MMCEVPGSEGNHWSVEPVCGNRNEAYHVKYAVRVKNGMFALVLAGRDAREQLVFTCVDRFCERFESRSPEEMVANARAFAEMVLQIPRLHAASNDPEDVQEACFPADPAEMLTGIPTVVEGASGGLRLILAEWNRDGTLHGVRSGPLPPLHGRNEEEFVESAVKIVEAALANRWLYERPMAVFEPAA